MFETEKTEETEKIEKTEKRKKKRDKNIDYRKSNIDYRGRGWVDSRVSFSGFSISINKKPRIKERSFILVFYRSRMKDRGSMIMCQFHCQLKRKFM